MKDRFKFFGSIVLCISLFLCMFAGCAVKEDNQVVIYQPICKTVNSVNHRGYYTAPENTLAAFRESAKKGFKMVECDVAFTQDGYAVLIHDETVDRTSNGKGRIDSLTFEEVRKLDFGGWKSSKYRRERIPTFEEFISLCRNLSLHPYIEIKTGTQEQVKSLVQTVIRYGMKDNVTWISFKYNNLKTVRNVDRTARLGYLVNSVSEETIANVTSLSTDINHLFINCRYSAVDSAAISLCIDNLIPLEVWIVDKEQDILELDPYISGVTSNKLIANKVLYDKEI